MSVESVFKILRETANRASNVILDAIPLIASADFAAVITSRRVRLRFPLSLLPLSSFRTWSIIVCTTCTVLCTL